MKQFDTNVAINTMDTIPKTLIYETINNKHYYYDGYKQIVKNIKKQEDIMGSSALQALIISTILRFLYKNTILWKRDFSPACKKKSPLTPL
jgi:hypothetical protein